MADLIDRAEALARKEWSYDLKQYVVSLKTIQRIPQAVTDESRELDRQKDMLKFLFNRCYACMSGMGVLCSFCGIKNDCEEMRTVGKEGCTDGND